MAQQKTTPHLFKKDLQTCWHFLSLSKEDALAQFQANRLVKRKFVLSQVSRQMKLNKFEPAPLLGVSVLDVGCGTCSLGEDLALRGADMTSIDINSTALSLAEESAKHYGTQIHFLKTKPETLLADSKKYKVILCLDVLEEVENKEKFLWALRKLLEDDGLLIFSNHNRTFGSFLLHIVVACWVKRLVPFGYYKFSRFFTPPALNTLLVKNHITPTFTSGLCFNPTTKQWQKSPTPCQRFFTVAKPTPTQPHPRQSTKKP